MTKTRQSARLEVAIAPATAGDLRIVARRLRGEAVGVIAKDLDRAHGYVEARSRRAAAHLLSTVEPEIVEVLTALWDAGESVQALSGRVPAGRSLVQLVVHGWPTPEDTLAPTLRRVWLEGGTWVDLAGAVGRSQAWAGPGFEGSTCRPACPEQTSPASWEYRGPP